MVTDIQAEKLAQLGREQGFFPGMTSLSNLLTFGRRGTGGNGQEDEKDWHHWLFLRLNGYEVHLSGPGVPVEPKDLDIWVPLLDDLSTLIFYPCKNNALGSEMRSETELLTHGMASLVGKLAPILASDTVRWTPMLDEMDFVSVQELHVKSYVAKKIIQDYDVAEALFRRALDLEPDNADILGDFALFMQEIRGDFEQAETLYRQAIQENPRHDKNLDNFAIFLHEVRKDYGAAEQFYRRALDVQPDNAIYLSNFALFLHEVLEDDDQAEDFYRRALQADGNDAAVLSNFALFLHDTRRDDDLAEQLYQRAILHDANDANCLGNFALFMKNVRQDYDAAEEYFSRAVRLDPGHAGHLGNFALFMKNIRRNYDAAEEFYHRALLADPNDANCLGSFASFMKNLRKDDDVAEDLYRRSLQIDPGNVNRLGNFVQLLLSQGRIKEGLPLLEKAIAMSGDKPELQLELWFYMLAHDPSRFALALGRIKGLIQEEGVRSKGWDLSSTCKRARMDAHPSPELLEALAKVLAAQGEVETLDDFVIWVEAESVHG